MTVAAVTSTELLFPEGLVGCPEWRRFRLEQKPDTAPVCLLHSLDQAGLSFIVADPRIWYSGYEYDVSAADLEALGVSQAQSLSVLVIITVEPNPFAVTANLLGPLVVNMSAGCGRQVIQSARPYLATQPLTLHVQMLTFEDGLIGYPEWRYFVLRRVEEMRPIRLLISRDMPALSLPVVDPWLIDPAYAPTLTPEDRAALGIMEVSHLQWLVILNVQANPLQVSANLLGPIAFNRQTGAARQIVLTGSDYSASHVIEDTFAQAVKEVERVSADAARG
jgi:flagellar assembly factor FliW